MKRAVVTGAAGFIGSHLSEELLSAGHEVIGLDSFTSHYDRALKELNLAPARAQDGFTFLEADLTDAALGEAVRGADWVFHLAARPGVRDSWDDFSDYVHSNIVGTKAVLDACAEVDDIRLIYASSSSVYGDAQTLPVSEDMSLKPISPYGASKVMTEVMAGAYGASRGLHTVGMRYFTVYGPRQRPDMGLSRFIEWASAGEPISIYGDGRQLRDFTYVKDIVDGTLLAAERGESGAVYNIGSGRPLPLLDVLDALGGVMGADLNLTFEAAKTGDVRDTHASIDLARSSLGFEPATDLSSGLAEQFAEAERRRSALSAA